MKVIFLNCCYLKVKEKILDYFASHKDTDVYCLQEVSSENLQLLTKIFTRDFLFLYNNALNNSKEYPNYGQLIVVKRNIKLICFESREVFKNLNSNFGFLQNIDIEVNNKRYSVGNIHGMSLPGHKNDTQARIKQSKITIDFYANKNNLKIIGGDFNLNPDTKSVKLFESAVYGNLIKDYEIKSTRNKLAWSDALKRSKTSMAKYYGKQHFADYCFVSSGIKVKSFEVPNIEISDHLPLILEFEPGL